jgi:nickel-dependent lactate racemase
VVDKIINTERGLSDTEVRKILAEGLGRLDLKGRRVLVVIPDGTRTAPIGLLFGLLGDVLGSKVKALDYLIALGTHPPMDDAAKSRLLDNPVVDGKAGRSRIFNHRWESPDTFATLGTIPASEVAAETDGMLEMDIDVRLNRLVGDEDGNTTYDHILVCGPVFPHEVAGFSGGNKYFVPGVAGQEVIDATHWVGALVTSQSIIGVRETPVRRLIDRAASFIPTPRSLIALVMHGQNLHGIFMGGMEEAWRAATELSAELDIVWVDQPFKRVLSVMPEMYDDLWTGAKGMYKLEPAIADNGEVVIYAPHITEVSYVHGHYIDQIGYHVRDYFTAQWDRFRHIPWGVLAHSTHLRGGGTFIHGVEKARIRVTLATGIPRERCEAIGLGYLDPARVDLDEWADREDDGILLVRRAGEQLYRVTVDNQIAEEEE